MNFETYKTFLSLNGKTEQERAINGIHRDINTLLPGNPSYKTVLLNGEERHLNIVAGSSNMIKNISAMPGEELSVGNHILYCGENYYVTECTKNDGVYAYGEMTQCTDVVNFISPYDGSIQTYPVIVVNTTKFNTGETPNKRLTLPSGQYAMYIPMDEHTIRIDNDFRIMLDKRKDYPSCYRVTYVDTSTYGYGDSLLNIVLLQTELNPERDNIELMIADYYPVKPEQEVAAITFDEGLTVRVGGTGSTITPVLQDGVSTPLKFSFTADKAVLDAVTYETTDTSITFHVKNIRSLIGSYITLTVMDSEGNNESTTLVQLKGLV